MLKVIIDYDDVLNDCNQAAIEKLNKEEGTRFLLSDIHKWGITRTLLDKRIEYFKDPLFMSTVPLRKGAKKFIKQLSKRYEVFIATSVHILNEYLYLNIWILLLHYITFYPP